MDYQIPISEKHLPHSNKYTYYKLHFHLKQGVDLSAKDRRGTSDPYVKFYIKDKKFHKSKIIKRNLNPEWDEKFSIIINDVSNPVLIKVSDYDLLNKDDFMGMAYLDLTKLDHNKLTEMEIILKDDKDKVYNYGKLLISVMLEANSNEEKENKKDYLLQTQISSSSLITEANKLKNSVITEVNKLMDSDDLSDLHVNLRQTEMEIILQDSKKLCNNGKLLLSDTLEKNSYKEKDFQVIQRDITPTKTQPKPSTPQPTSTTPQPIVTIELLEGKELKQMDPDGLSDPYVKFRLGNWERKSSCKRKTVSPCWNEQFKIRLYDKKIHLLDITVWDKDLLFKDDFMGRCKVDLSQLEHEIVHEKCLEVREGTGYLYVKLKIEKPGDDKVEDYKKDNLDKEDEDMEIIERYEWQRTFEEMKDVGYLQVKVFRARGLPAKPIGVRNPFCVLELVNSHMKIDPVLGTLSPYWNKIFHFNVKDIHSPLEVTVLDDDGNQRPELLGKIVIPLHRIKNGERKWYVLKNKSLRYRAKGTKEKILPEILLECSLHCNMIRATARSIEPREDKFKDEKVKFKVTKFNSDFYKFQSYTKDMTTIFEASRSIMRWDKPCLSIVAYILALLAIYSFELYMLPLALVLLFLKTSVMLFIKSSDNIEEVKLFKGNIKRDYENEEKQSALDWINAHTQLDEAMLKVQKVVRILISVIERCENTLMFCVPFMTWMIVALLLTVTIVLYLVPVRYLIMIPLIVNAFEKLVRLYRGQHLNSSKAVEVMYSLLTCIPDNEEKLDFQEPCRGSAYHPSDIIEDATSDELKRK